jgi:hypothetical protein
VFAYIIWSFVVESSFLSQHVTKYGEHLTGFKAVGATTASDAGYGLVDCDSKMAWRFEITAGKVRSTAPGHHQAGITIDDRAIDSRQLIISNDSVSVSIYAINTTKNLEDVESS